MLTIVTIERYYTVISNLKAVFSNNLTIWLKPMKPANSLSMHFASLVIRGEHNNAIAENLFSKGNL